LLKILSLTPSYQAENCVRSSPDKVCLIELGFGMRAHIIQIASSVEEVGIVPLLACEIK